MASLTPMRTWLSVTFAGTDVTADMSADLLSFAYTDKETDESDDIRFTLMDPLGKWAGAWCPDGGEKVTATIFSGTSEGVVTGALPCGTFSVDSLTASGAPRVMEICAVSVPIDTPIRRKARSKSWEKTALRDIASAIAEAASLTLLWDVADDTAPEYDRVDQSKETDLAFLRRLCRDAGLSVKVTDVQLVVFDQKSYEKKDPVLTLTLGVSGITQWRFATQKAGTYKSVKVSWRDPKKKTKGSAASHRTESSGTSPSKTSGNPAVNEYVYEDSNAGEDGQEFEVKKMCRSQAEAEALAKAKLRELNRRSVTGSLTMVGDVRIVAGVVIALAGFGAWNGNYIVESAAHAVGGGGHTVSVDLRKVNTRY